jgi:hypothetical protein
MLVIFKSCNDNWERQLCRSYLTSHLAKNFNNNIGNGFKVKNYEGLFAQVTTVNVLIAEPTMPANIAPNTAWFTTICGRTAPSHDTTLGTTRKPTEPIEKPSAQKIKIATPLDIMCPPLHLQIVRDSSLLYMRAS